MRTALILLALPLLYSGEDQRCRDFAVQVSDQAGAYTLSIAPPAATGKANPYTPDRAGTLRLPLSVTALRQADQPTQVRLAESYGKLPLSFEANQGQTDPPVKFLSRGSGYTLFLTSTEVVLALKKSAGQKTQQRASLLDKRTIEKGEASFSSTALRMKLVGANPESKVTGLEELPGKSNYFIGNDPSQWHTNVSNFAKVKYQDVYPGVDLVYYGNQRRLEYDFVVAPGADPHVIRLCFKGLEKSDGHPPLQIDSEGNLVLVTPAGKVQLNKPLVYQEVGGARKEIPGQYVLDKEDQVGFTMARYDTSRPLVIDPVLSYSTYLGGNGDERAFGIALDSSGNAYVTGFTKSLNFPTAGTPFQSALTPLQSASSAGFDAFVSKLNVAGSLVYSTYLGGRADDLPTGLALDASGNAYLTGKTSSDNFPTAGTPFQSSHGGGFDAFISKLNPAGSSLVYSTYLGGNSFDHATAITLDSSGNAYLTGSTFSGNFPTAGTPFQSSFGGAGDAFVSKLNAAGSSLVYSTYLGGNGDDRAFGIALDSSGNAYLTGKTSSSNFPTAGIPFQSSHGGGFDAFVSKLNAAGSSLIYSTYLGGSGTDQANAIALDSVGNAYLTGKTSSSNFPTVGTPFQSSLGGGFDAFVTKLNAAGSSLVYSTYVGGNRDDQANAMVLDSSGNAYLTGETSSANFPTAGTPFQPSLVQSPDAFLSKLNAAGSSLVYSTYLGGSNDDTANAMALDSAGNVYLTGFTASGNFPTAGIPFQSSFGGAVGGGSNDAFVAKLTGFGPASRPALYFPLLEFSADLYTGFALANPANTEVATVSLEAFNDSGVAIGSSIPLTVGPNQQIAKLTQEVFSALGPNEPGWFRVSRATGSVPLKGFFLHGRSNLATIDGVDVNDRLSTDLVFPIIGETSTGKSQVVLVNPNLIDAKLTLELLGALGSNEPLAAKRLKKENFTLARLSRLEKTASELFDGADIAALFGLDSAGGQLYLRVQSDLGLFGFQTLPERTSTSDFVALRGQDVATESGNELFFAHLAEGSGFETVLSLINLKTPAVSASVDVKIVLDNGITETVNRILPPGGVLRTKLRDLFSVLSGNTVAVGYIRATSKDATLDSGPVTAGPMMGSITFQHALHGATAALPGQRSPSAQLTFSHVAVQDVNVTNDAWLTGIALLNPSTTADAIVKITVRKPDGTEAGARDNFLLKAGERKSRLLVELVREVKNQAGGYIVVESKKADGSNLPIYGFELFGDWFLKKLAAVPAQ